MKKIITYFIIVCSISLSAQINPDCVNAIPLCSNPNFTFNATSGPGNVVDFTNSSTISNPINNPFPPNAGCLKSGELNPQWLILTIGNTGTLEFVFGAGNSANPQVGCYDWAMWPYSSTSCAGIFNNTLPPIRCNWNATCNGGTGIASAANIAAIGGNAGDFEPPLSVTACQQYIICISNYSGVNTLVSFQTLGTASLICSPNCNPNYTVCAGNSVTITPVNFNGLNNPTYSIQPGGTTNTTGSFVVNPTSTTTYTTYITGTNSNNSVQTTTATSMVSVNPSPSLNPTFTVSTCTNTNNAVNLGLTFNPPGNPSYTVNWSPTPGSVTSNTQTSATNLNAGTTGVTVTAAGGCSTTTNFAMNVAVPPTVTVTNVTNSFSITCATPSITMTANSSYTNGSLNYLWSSPSFTANTQTVNLTQAGNYTLCVIDPATNCSACETFTIGQNITNPTFTVNPVSQVINCNAGAATFSSTAISPTTNIVHEWYCPSNPPPTGPASFTSGNVVSPYNAICGPGVYYVVLRDLINGCISTKTVEVTTTAGFPSFQTSSTTNYTLGCNPSSMTLCIVNVTSAINGPTNFSFLSPGTPFAIPLPTVAFSSINCTTAATPGTWTLVVQDITNGCQTALPIVVLQNTIAPSVSYTMSPVNSQTLTCFNPTLMSCGSSSTANTQVTWVIPSTPPALSAPCLIIGPVTGPPTSTTNLAYAVYTVVATNTVNGCTTTQTVLISQNFRKPTPLLTVGNPSVLTCKNDPVVLNYTGFTGGSGILGAVATTTPFGWTGPAPQVNLTGTNTYSAGIAGIYTLTVQDNKNGCVGTGTYNVIDQKQPPVILNPNTTFTLDCGNGTGSSALSASMQVVLSSSLSSWSFYMRDYPDGANFGPTAATGGSVIQQPTGLTSTGSFTSQTVTTDLTGVYKYIVTNKITGCIAQGTINVVGGGLTADFTPNVTSGFAPLNVTFINNNSTSTGASSIIAVWDFGNGSTFTSTGNIPTGTNYTAPGTYTVQLAASKGLCFDTVQKVIRVDIPSKLEIPNVFTPNGDGSNDVFFLKVANLGEINALIFDRWGNKVHDVTSSTGNIGWDGKNIDGKECPAGTYFYIIKASGRDGKEYEQKGHVSLYR